MVYIFSVGCCCSCLCVLRPLVAVIAGATSRNILKPIGPQPDLPHRPTSKKTHTKLLMDSQARLLIQNQCSAPGVRDHPCLRCHPMTSPPCMGVPDPSGSMTNLQEMIVGAKTTLFLYDVLGAPRGLGRSGNVSKRLLDVLELFYI